MTLQEKQEALAEILDCEAASLLPEIELDTLAWDSMARVSLVAVARARFGVRISGAELKTFTTLGDIYAALDRGLS